MGNERKWYLWPRGYIEGFVPWFVILRRLTFYPALLLGMSVTFLAVLGGFSLSDAKRTWRNTR